MEVSVEAGEGLERKLKIMIPDNKVASEIDSRVQELSKTAWVEGFRAGKVPERVIRTKYGKAINEEVIGKIVHESVESALKDQDLRLASQPQVNHKDYIAGQPLEIEAGFEVMPEIVLKDVSGITVERLTCAINDSDVDNTLEKLRKHHTEWKTVERACADSDQAVIDFTGTVAGEALEDGSAEDFELVLGDNTMIDGFEAGILGKSAGDEFKLELTFPADYFKEDLAGKPVQFDIKVKTINEGVLPELNDAFAEEKLGIQEGGLSKLREEIQKRMNDDVAKLVKSKNNQALNKQMLALYEDLAMPNSMVQQEQLRLQQQALEQLKRMMEQGQAQAGGMPQVPEDMYASEAIERIKLGLLFSKISAEQELQADGDKVREKINQMAEGYAQPEQIINWYYSDPERLKEIEAMVLEETVVENLLAACQVTDKAVTYEELVEQA